MARTGNGWPVPAAVRCRFSPDRAAKGAVFLAAFLTVTLPPTAVGAAAPPAMRTAELSFRIVQGNEINAFLRSGDIAAQLVVRGGAISRLIVAFPAGDSGIGLWLTAPAGQMAHWRLLRPPRPVRQTDTHGRQLRGLQADLEADAGSLRIEQALLSSVRILRNFEAGTAIPSAIATSPQLRGDQVWWLRDRLDGAAGYRLTLQALGGASFDAHRLQSSRGTHRLRLTALSGDAPLTPIPEAELLRGAAAPDLRERRLLTFLSYRQKYLAGAWRFDTYFGRDTLFSLLLLAPILQPAALVDGIDSVLVRLSPSGEVAHEESIGEYAVILNAAAGRGRNAAPVYDYSMLDESFLLAPLMARWLLEDAANPASRAALLAARDARGERRGDALLRNLRYVVQQTQPFARQPDPFHLIGLQPGRRAGDWRDSEDGLDGGRYPFDVNVVFAPAALQAVQRLLDSGLLRPYLSADDASLLAQATAQRAIWHRDAAPLFRVQLSRSDALRRARVYANRLGVDPQPAAAALPPAGLTYAALSLDASARPLPVMHSDEVFQLLLEDPDAATLSAALDTLTSPFPAGLMTPIGLLVANPAFAGLDTQRRFTPAAYHGAVVWAWQQAVLLAGMNRQLQRRDLPAPLRGRLFRARVALWKAVQRASALRGSELWSWSIAAGRYQLQSFRPEGRGEAESDAAQLWSTVFLALQPAR